MDAIENILSRKSVREFSDKNISQEDIKTILTAGMSGPSAVNMRPFDFIVTQKRELLERISDEIGRYSDPIKKCNLGILVCGDSDKGYLGKDGYWPLDCAIAAQNMILAAHALGIGSVWIAVYPERPRYSGLQKLFSLKDHVYPLAALAFGYPLDDKREIRDQYEVEKVHWDKW